MPARSYSTAKLERVWEIQAMLDAEAEKKRPNFRSAIARVPKKVENATAEETYLAVTGFLIARGKVKPDWLDFDPYEVHREAAAEITNA